MTNPESGVMEEVSPASENETDQSGSGEQPSKGLDPKRWENLQKENQRKSQEIKELKENNIKMAEQYKSVESRLNELQAKFNPTPREEDEIKQLEEWKNSVKDNPDFKKWHKLIGEEGLSAADKKVQEYDYNKALKQVGKLADSEGMSREDFEKEILEIFKTRRIEGMPTDRLEEAYGYWKKDRTAKLSAEKEEQERLKGNPSLNGSRVSRPTSYKDVVKKAQETGDFSDVLSALAEKQKKDNESA